VALGLLKSPLLTKEKIRRREVVFVPTYAFKIEDFNKKAKAPRVVFLCGEGL